MSSVLPNNAVQYVYDFALLDQVPAGATSARVAAKRLLSGPTLQTGKSSTVGAVLTGLHLIVTLGRQTRGSGAKAHTHPNEQINYIVQGVMTGEIEGEQVFAPVDTLLHTPSRAVHTGMACPDEDLVFFAMKDTRHGIVGPPVDGQYNGPNFLPGFGTRATEAAQSTAQLMAACRGDTAGEKTRYIYDFARLAENPDAWPAPRSPQMWPQASGPAIWSAARPCTWRACVRLQAGGAQYIAMRMTSSYLLLPVRSWPKSTASNIVWAGTARCMCRRACRTV